MQIYRRFHSLEHRTNFGTLPGTSTKGGEQRARAGQVAGWPQGLHGLIFFGTWTIAEVIAEPMRPDHPTTT